MPDNTGRFPWRTAPKYRNITAFATFSTPPGKNISRWVHHFFHPFHLEKRGPVSYRTLLSCCDTVLVPYFRNIIFRDMVKPWALIM